MSTTRREFMRNVGITLATLLTGGCDLASWLSRNTTDGATPSSPGITPQPVNNPPALKTGFPQPTCYAPIPTLDPDPPATSTPRPTPTRVLPPAPTCYKPPEPTKAPAQPYANDKSHWHMLRACWLDLSNAQLKSATETDYSRDLVQRHARALEALKSNGMEPDVAQAIAIAFQHAVTHIQRQTSTCYVSIPAEYVPRQNLTRQASMLAEMAQHSQINPDTVLRIRQSLARDMAWLERFQTGITPEALESIEITPTEIEATRLLVELLLWKG